MHSICEQAAKKNVALAMSHDGAVPHRSVIRSRLMERCPSGKLVCCHVSKKRELVKRHQVVGMRRNDRDASVELLFNLQLSRGECRWSENRLENKSTPPESL